MINLTIIVQMWPDTSFLTFQKANSIFFKRAVSQTFGGEGGMTAANC